MVDSEEKTANEIILCIGYFTVYMNTFEMMISQLNKTLLNFSYNEFEDLFLGKKMIYEKMEVTKQLLKIIPFADEIRKEALTHLGVVNNLRTKRNNYIHGLIHTVEEEGVQLPGLYIKSIRDWDKIGNEKIDITELEKIKLEMLKAVQTQEQINIKLIASYYTIQNDRKIKSELVSRIFKENEKMNYDDFNL